MAADIVAALVMWVVYLSSWSLLLAALATNRRRLARPSAWAIGLWLAVAIPSMTQEVVPSMLSAGDREVDAVLDGEWWRVATANVLQDGGWAGTVFNLTTLAVSVLLAGAVVRGSTMVALFVIGGVVCNAVTVVTFAQSGAGNSMATMVMVAALGLSAVVLLTLRNMHGLTVGLDESGRRRQVKAPGR